MIIRLPSRKTLALAFSGLVLFYLLFGWLALPRILQWQAEKFVAEKTGHHLSMEQPEFNPFAISLRLSGLRLTQADGEPLLAFRELLVDMSAASIFRGAFVFDGIRLDGVETTVALLPDDRLNWSKLLDSLKSEEPPQDASLPRLYIHSFILADSRLDFADKRIVPAFATRIEPLNLELTDISTLPNDKGQYHVAAHTASGASIDWRGEIGLAPLAMTGNLSVRDVNIASLATYLKDRLPIAPPDGIASLSADYRLGYAAGKMGLNLEHVAAGISGLRLRGKQDTLPLVAIETIELKEGSFDSAKNSLALGVFSVTGSSFDLLRSQDGAPKAVELGSFTLEKIRADLSSHQLTLGRIALKDGRIRAARTARGSIDLLEAVQALFPATQSGSDNKKTDSNTAAASPWRYRADKLELSGFGVSLRDAAITPAAELALDDISLSLEGISEDWQAAVPLRTAFNVRSGGSFTAEGKIIPAGPTADIQLKLADLSLAPAQPYLSSVAKLTLVGGRLSSAGRVSYSNKGIGYKGSFALRDLRVSEAGTGNLILALKSLNSRALSVTPAKLDMDELAVDGLDTQLIIAKDKTLSIKRVLLQPAQPVAAPNPPAAAKSARPFIVNIDRLRFSHGELDFADYSLALPFGTRIHDMHGAVVGLSSQPGAPGQLELDGQVDDYGLARAVGQIDLFNPTDFMDLKVIFRNVEMTRLTPYSATFAGRKITSGKLSLDLEYKIKQRQLQGENQVIMDQLTLGERVESPEAMSLPLDLAIAILQDADGRIDLGLPVSGSLDDPQFGYGRIVWKAIVNVLTKIVTAPFRALGALFGSNEKFESIAFEPGDAHLTPPEREKLVRLAGALLKRPGLSLEVHGGYAETDRAALRDRQMRRAVAEQIGQHVEEGDDPGPISTRQPKVQEALESLYSAQFGEKELLALKDNFRQANPGQLEESTSAKMISRLSGLFRKKPVPSEQEVAYLKGADFYGILFERLLDKVVVNDARILALGMSRGEATVAALKAAGAPAERLLVKDAEKVEMDGRDIPVKLVLGVAAKAAAPAASGVPAN